MVSPVGDHDSNFFFADAPFPHTLVPFFRNRDRVDRKDVSVERDRETLTF
jgi:hypothetical protein